MAELQDAQRLGRCVRKDVGMEVPLPAPHSTRDWWNEDTLRLRRSAARHTGASPVSRKFNAGVTGMNTYYLQTVVSAVASTAAGT